MLDFYFSLNPRIAIYFLVVRPLSNECLADIARLKLQDEEKYYYLLYLPDMAVSIEEKVDRESEGGLVQVT